MNRVSVFRAALALSFTLCTALAHAGQTLVFLRHAEKPAAGLGQLTCQGMNRALALPRVLTSEFGTPTALFAPNPGLKKNDKGTDYNYIRPLATIEPTAVRAGLPVEASIAFEEVGTLTTALLAPALHEATVFVAWEHHWARNAVADLLQKVHADGSTVPQAWADDDFDSLYVVRIDWSNPLSPKATFSHQQEGLNGQSTQCPF